MKIRAVFVTEQETEWAQLFTRFDTLAEARETLRQLPDRKLIWLEEDHGRDHDWEAFDGDDHHFQCKQCGAKGVKDGKGVRPTRRVGPDVVLGCRPERILDNVPESAKWAAQIRNEGFR